MVFACIGLTGVRFEPTLESRAIQMRAESARLRRTCLGHPPRFQILTGAHPVIVVGTACFQHFASNANEIGIPTSA
ncbi:hypothetical protein BDV93DRAFT_259009 [Ceratobasidium sp. AG-I]|nr:hypothetical protein BDV93DRAFT_259009 [Ceratobasidium sp. AG-I]